MRPGFRVSASARPKVTSDLSPWGRSQCSFTMAEDRPARVATIRLGLQLPVGFPEARRPALRRVVEACTVHNSITHPPRIEIALGAADAAA